MNNLSVYVAAPAWQKCAAGLILAVILSACQSFSPPQRNTGSDSSSERSTLICDHAQRWQGQVVGDGHCVSLIKRCAKAPLTKFWRPGKAVQGNAILPGTIVATFAGQHYPSKSGYHAAIFIEQTDEGMWVWDQWRGKPVHRRLIRWQNPGAKKANQAKAYQVVMVAK